MTDEKPAPERRARREQDPAQLRWIAQARCLAATLDLLRHPILLLVPGEPIRVWHANAAARHDLGEHAAFHVREGLLQCSPAGLDALRPALAQARRLGAGHPQRFVLRADAHATGGTVQALDFGASTDLPVTELVMLEMQAATTGEPGLRDLCGEFGLTRKEAEVAIGLYSMGSVEELARCAGKSVHTIRTQLKAAMQKTGRRTQAALVAAVADRLGPARRL